jgi:hypothetical protein
VGGDALQSKRTAPRHGLFRNGDERIRTADILLAKSRPKEIPASASTPINQEKPRAVAVSSSFLLFANVRRCAAPFTQTPEKLPKGRSNDGEALDADPGTQPSLSAGHREVALLVSSARVADIAAVVVDAPALWRRAAAADDVDGQKALARAVCRRLGGLTVCLDHTLRIGSVPDNKPQRVR